MKKSFYSYLYRIFSILSDKTKGFPLFVRYKIFFGILIIGLADNSCMNRKIPDYYASNEVREIEIIQNDSIVPSFGKKGVIQNSHRLKRQKKKGDIQPFSPDKKVEDTIRIAITCYISIDIDNYNDEYKSAFESVSNKEIQDEN